MNIQPTFQDPSQLELSSRVDKVVKVMQQKGLDYYVISDVHNVFWLTNFANFVHERPFILVLSKNAELKFVVPRLEVRHVKSRAVGEIELVSYEEFPSASGKGWETSFKKIISDADRVGIEDNCPYYLRESIKAKVIPSEAIEKIRYIKSDFEISRIKYASNIAVDRLTMIINSAQKNVSMINIHAKFNKLAMLKVLLDNPETNMLATNLVAVVQPPVISDDPHNFTSIENLGTTDKGPHVSIVAGIINGYGTEVERTFFIEEVPERAKRPFQVMLEARALTRELVKPGASMHDVDVSVKHLLRSEGYENILHRTGHGIGVTGHEGPFLAEGYDEEIREGMIFTVEPAIYIEGFGGFRHSDTILVTKDGNQNLTEMPDSLTDMTVQPKRFSLRMPASLEKPLMKLYARAQGLQIHEPGSKV